MANKMLLFGKRIGP